MTYFIILFQILNFNENFSQVIARHDTGNCVLQVTARACIGDTRTYTANIPNGFRYPRGGPDWLYFGGFAVGNAITYVADGFFGVGGLISRDFRVVDSLRRVFRVGAQEWECSYIDLTHPTPKNLKVKQYSIASPNPLYDDGVLMEFKIENTGTATVPDLYAGIFFDLDSLPGGNRTRGGTDTVKRCAWMCFKPGVENPTIGMKILAPRTWANLALVDHALYVYPVQGMHDSIKYKFLSGAIRMYASDRDFDWTIVASVGPFSLEPGQKYTCAFAILGGTSISDFLANAENLQGYYDQLVGLSENRRGNPKEPVLKLNSNFLTNNTRIQLFIPENEEVSLTLYDVCGKLIRSLAKVKGPCNKEIYLKPDYPKGIYFLRLEGGKVYSTTKVVYLNR